MTVVDINIHHLPEDLFTNPKMLNGFLNSAPRGFGEIARVETLDSGKQHHSNESGNENTEDQIGTFIYSAVDDMQVVQCRMNRRNNGINLGGVSCAEHSQDAEQGIKNR